MHAAFHRPGPETGRRVSIDFDRREKRQSVRPRPRTPVPRCPLCLERFPHQSLRDHIDAEARDIREYTIRLIKAEHPQWVRADGSCPECWEYYKRL